MQRDPKKCNAMQWNATQCNAMHCNAPQCNAMQCNAMQRARKHFNKLATEMDSVASWTPESLL
eukprot:4297066-Lingulodinium_polyedra.AAC.1